MRLEFDGSIHRNRGSAPLGAPQKAATVRPPSVERYIAVPITYMTSGFCGSAYIRPPALASCRVPSVHVSPPSSERYTPRLAAGPAPRPPVPAIAYSRRPCVPDASANAEMRAPSGSPRTPATFHVAPASVDLKSDASVVSA